MITEVRKRGTLGCTCTPAQRERDIRDGEMWF